MNVGESIKYYRKKRGLTQKKLAELTGIAEITIRQYESSKYEPKRENLYKIGKELDVNINQLIKLPSINFDDTPVDNPYNRALNKIERGVELTDEERETFQKEFQEMVNKIPDVFTNFADSINDTYNNLLLSYFNSLNASGKTEALKRIQELTYIPKYIEK